MIIDHHYNLKPVRPVKNISFHLINVSTRQYKLSAYFQLPF